MCADDRQAPRSKCKPLQISDVATRVSYLGAVMCFTALPRYPRLGDLPGGRPPAISTGEIVSAGRRMTFAVFVSVILNLAGAMLGADCTDTQSVAEADPKRRFGAG